MSVPKIDKDMGYGFYFLIEKKTIKQKFNNKSKFSSGMIDLSQTSHDN